MRFRLFAALFVLSASIISVGFSQSARAVASSCVDANWTYNGGVSPPTCTRTFSYINGSSTDSFTVPGGVTLLTLNMYGGIAANGDGEQGDSGYTGRVAGTLAVQSGDSVVIAVGGNSTGNNSNSAVNVGLNPLPGYDGGRGG
ncbi:MAG: hypothetical protein FGM42_11030, partial [Ilumatobacteraceae bacterium]|nr:hypothetical protein [Ilumatobacteraceae bacterium]